MVYNFSFLCQTEHMEQKALKCDGCNDKTKQEGNNLYIHTCICLGVIILCAHVYICMWTRVVM